MQKLLSRFLFVSLCLLGCDMEPIEIDLSDGYLPEPVVSTFISPDAELSVLLDASRAAYASKPTCLSFEQTTLKDLINDNEYLFTPCYRPGFWRVEGFYPEVHGIYQIQSKIAGSNQVIKATDTIPPPCQIHSINIQAVNLYNLVQMQITLPVNNNSISYFEVLVYSQTLLPHEDSSMFSRDNLSSSNPLFTREEYYPSLLLLEADSPESLLFRSEASGGRLSLDFLYATAISFNYGGNMQAMAPEHHLVIELRSVSLQYFLHKTSRYKQQYAMKGDVLYGMAPPVEVHSNIHNGRGIFAGYSSVKSDTLFIPERVITNYDFDTRTNF